MDKAMPAQKKRPMIERIGDSLSGLRLGCRREASIRAHLLGSTIAVAALAMVRPPLVWSLAALIALAVSLAAEYFNAAIEALLDKLHPEQDSEIGAAKDMASAAAFVLNCLATVTCVAAVGAGALG